MIWVVLPRRDSHLQLRPLPRYGPESDMKGYDDINLNTYSNVLNDAASGWRIRAWACRVRSLGTSSFNIMAAELGTPLHNAAGCAAGK